MGVVLELFSCMHPMYSPGRELYVSTACPATVLSANSASQYTSCLMLHCWTFGAVAWEGTVTSYICPRYLDCPDLTMPEKLHSGHGETSSPRSDLGQRRPSAKV